MLGPAIDKFSHLPKPILRLQDVFAVSKFYIFPVETIFNVAVYEHAQRWPGHQLADL
jgi:hypothetical protein